jgi:hypothetical protein
MPIVRSVFERLLHLATREWPEVSPLLGAAAVGLNASSFLELRRRERHFSAQMQGKATFWRRLGAARSCLIPFSFSKASALEIVIFS